MAEEWNVGIIQWLFVFSFFSANVRNIGKSIYTHCIYGYSTHVNSKIFASGAEDYCLYDRFSPKCPNGNVIMMNIAKFGRMNKGKCVPVSFGKSPESFFLRYRKHILVNIRYYFI